jgi:L-lactate dehydrogenase complex protein LldE
MLPCYIDLLSPEIGVATLELLEKLEVVVIYHFDQTCCAQPMANNGCHEESQANIHISPVLTRQQEKLR